MQGRAGVFGRGAAAILSGAAVEKKGGECYINQGAKSFESETIKDRGISG